MSTLNLETPRSFPHARSLPPPPSPTSQFHVTRPCPGEVDRAVRLSHWLEPAERALFQSVYRDGIPIDVAASMIGLSGATTRRRLRRLWLRVNHPEYGWVVVRMHGWEPIRRSVAVASILHGLSLRSVCERLGLSMHATRAHLSAIHTAFDLEATARHLKVPSRRHAV